MQKLLFLLLLLTSQVSILLAQGNGQIIRGKVLDKITQQPLVAVTVIVSGSSINGSTDENGNFLLPNVPLGRQSIEAQYLGYKTYKTEELIVSSAKELYIEITMSEEVQVTQTVEITASQSSDGVGNRALNELSTVSVRSFSTEETQRYAASINDPSRMAAALPGVQADGDNQNDVIIRGNSAAGVLWRLEGLDIENPNHYAKAATSGGGISVFSAALLGNTDFSTGAFAAEYGNAFSGVFDMRFRKGNKANREYTFKAGVVGLDFSTEGPIQKGQSSYLLNYRYSTLGILNSMGIYVVRENVANSFQDIAFNVTLSSPDNKNEVKVFGVGGISNEQWFVKTDTAEWIEPYDFVHEQSGSHLGVLGLSFRRLLNDKSYFKLTVGSVLNHNYLRQAEAYDITNIEMRDTFINHQYNLLRSQIHANYSIKFNNQLRLKTGLSLQVLNYWLNYKDNLIINNQLEYTDVLNETGITYWNQAYAQLNYRPNAKLTFNAGFHALHFGLNNSMSLEPRIAAKYQISPKSSFSAAYGIHGQILPIGNYFTRSYSDNSSFQQLNKDLDIAKMHHTVVSYEQVLGGGFRGLVEAYYQYGFDMPTGVDSTFNYWYFNQRDNYTRQQLVSEGNNRNYGFNATLEKAFSRSFFVLLSGSLYWAEYKTQFDT